MCVCVRVSEEVAGREVRVQLAWVPKLAGYAWLGLELDGQLPGSVCVRVCVLQCDQQIIYEILTSASRKRISYTASPKVCLKD